MTEEEWIKNNCIESNLDFLKICGFDVSVEEMDNKYMDNKYYVAIKKGDFIKLVFNVRHLEVIVDVLKEYRRMEK